jgi:hypothetical protein
MEVKFGKSTGDDRGVAGAYFGVQLVSLQRGGLWALEGEAPQRLVAFNRPGGFTRCAVGNRSRCHG